MQLHQIIEHSPSQLGSPLRRNASPIGNFRQFQQISSNTSIIHRSQFQKANQQSTKGPVNQMQTRNKIRQHRVLRKDDPLLICSPINQFRKSPPKELFIQYLDGEISTQDLVNFTTLENRKDTIKKQKKLLEQKSKKKPSKLNVLQKFLQEKINKRTSLTETPKISKITDRTKNEISINDTLSKISNSSKKLKQLQILFFPKIEIDKTDEPVFNYKQIFNIESDQLLQDIQDEKKRLSQEKFHQIGKEMVIKLQSRKQNREPRYIPMEREVIISKDVQLYGYLHESQKQIKIKSEEKHQQQKIVYMKYKGTERRIPIKQCLKYQRLYVPDDPYMMDDPYSSDSSLASDQQSYNLSTLRFQDMKQSEEFTNRSIKLNRFTQKQMTY